MNKHWEFLIIYSPRYYIYSLFLFRFNVLYSFTNLHITKPPRLNMVSSIRIEPHNPVVGDTDDLISLMSHEADDKHRLSVVSQVLPRFDVLQLRFEQWEVFHVRVAFEDALCELWRKG